ncbi:HNH endonuclease [Bdellovibrio sp. KM01]|uniref:HNH endonuclease n=1 Tax=Bdellovibrio sp. KM01 TaxID=2748865 RepID=UPI0015EA0E28|nr:HNH endonuclease signature motif containing protein [Bdellovibrio sp. KM01]QLY27013.1 HNH endonuclease [Bdellovibrio sp. KM01]
MDIHAMCDDEVESRLKYLAGKERELLQLVLTHINEIETRRIFLARGHSTMYEYLTKELQYSGAAAMRRLSAARLLREIPGIAGQIHKGSVNLSQLSELSRALREKEKLGVEVSRERKIDILRNVLGKNTLDTQREIAQGLNIKLKKPEQVRMQKDESVHLAITFTRAQHELVIKARDKAAHLMTNENGRDHSFSSFFEILAKSYLFDRLSLKRPARTNKTLTVKTRNMVLTRDQSCQYIDPKTGKKCESTYGLEADHRVPRWAGGNHELNNLQAFCSAHNKFKYQIESGIKKH